MNFPLIEIAKHFKFARFNIFENKFVIDKTTAISWSGQEEFIVIDTPTYDTMHKGTIESCINFIKSTRDPKDHQNEADWLDNLPHYNCPHCGQETIFRTGCTLCERKKEIQEEELRKYNAESNYHYLPLRSVRDEPRSPPKRPRFICTCKRD